MKTLEDYVALSYRMEIIEDKDEGGFVVSSLDLLDCIICGRTTETTVSNMRDAKRAWTAVASEDGVEIPELDSLEDYPGQLKLRTPRSLHCALAQYSRQEDISMNQYCLYPLSHNDALRIP